MKARVKATGERWEFSQIDEITFRSAINGHLYCAEELEFLEPSVFTPDYWARLEHQYTGMFMKSFLDNFDGTVSMDQLADDAINLAHAIVEKYKGSV